MKEKQPGFFHPSSFRLHPLCAGNKNLGAGGAEESVARSEHSVLYASWAELANTPVAIKKQV